MALKSEEKSVELEFIFKSFLAGGVAGMFSKTTVAPLDRIKILLQAHNVHYKHLGKEITKIPKSQAALSHARSLAYPTSQLKVHVSQKKLCNSNANELCVYSGLKEIIKRERFFALYKGNGAQMVRIFPYAATQFTFFEMYKKWSEAVLGANSHIGKFVSGSAAGVTAVLFTYPLDTIRARLAFQVTGEHVYTGIVHTGVCIYQQEGGIRALYRGLLPTICGMIPYAGFSFYCFEMLKYCCMKYLPQYTCSPCSRNTGGLVLSLPAKLLCGGLAGAAAQSFSYPMDVTRRRMQLAMMNPETKKFAMGMVNTLVLIYKDNGLIQGLYRGMSINYIRAIPMVAVSFSTYEVMKQALQLDTGMKV